MNSKQGECGSESDRLTLFFFALTLKLKPSHSTRCQQK
jgi:hypothetical protein